MTAALTAPASRNISDGKRTSHIIRQNAKRKFLPYWKGSSAESQPYNQNLAVRPAR